ncbi:MAG: Gfo/Idh/MocA family oxidoreductase, partial [Anaerolineae bacterium]|nr:Gfo/Idh/MocA family oxidoreductase [Anaerolineae bacterium]
RGELGTVSVVRVRLAHDGALTTAAHPEGWLPQRFYDIEQARGGALIDLGCHPVYLLHTFLGRPLSVQATFGYLTGRAVEDHAVVTFGYANGAIGVAETGFVSAPAPIQIEVQGTLGRLQYGLTEERVRVLKQGASTWTTIDPPPDLPTPFELWVAQIQDGVDGTENLNQAYALTEVMEAAYASVNLGRTVMMAG